MGCNLVVKVEKVSFTGQGVSHSKEGKVLLIPLVIPEEVVEVKIVERKKDYDRGEVVKIIEPSSLRRKPACQYCRIEDKDASCGGCPFLHIEYKGQLNLKKEIFLEVFNKNSIHLPSLSVVSDLEEGYRARITLNDGSFYAKNSNHLIPITSCLCATKEINCYLSSVPPSKRPKGRVTFFGASGVKNSNVKGLSSIVQGLTTERKEEGSPSFSSILEDPERVELNLEGKTLLFSASSFFQSNLNLLIKVAKDVRPYVEGGRLLDLYGGSGTFSLLLSEYIKSTVLVERSYLSCRAASYNLKTLPNSSVLYLSDTEWIKSKLGEKSFNVAFLDPPRNGSTRQVLSYLADCSPSYILYLSCNIASQARDSKVLQGLGYKVIKATLYDFYPNTADIESLLVFSRSE